MLVIALLAMLFGLWHELRDVDEPVVAAPAAPAAARARPVATTPRPTVVPPTAPPIAVVPDRVDVPSTRSTAPMLDGVDPCAAVEEPEPPATFEVKSVGSITLAWRTEPDLELPPISPAMIGRIAEGLLEDAADATGTTVRGHLTVVIYPTIAQLRADTHAPIWAGGLYDGAVRIAESRVEGTGVNLAVLRHEIMHAQLHSTVGCMPSWFNEGIATYFENNPDLHAIVDLVREHELLDVEAMAAPAIQDLPAKHEERLYTESLAMVMYALDHGDGELRTLVSRYAAARKDQRMAIWTRWFPEARAPQLVEYVAHRVFGMATGDALDTLLHGAVCCTGWRDLSKLSCRAPGAPPPDGERSFWVDRSRTPHAMCDAHL